MGWTPSGSRSPLKIRARAGELERVETRFMEDADYAVVASVPVDAPGLSYVYGRQSCDTRSLEGDLDVGNAGFAGQVLFVAAYRLPHLFNPFAGLRHRGHPRRSPIPVGTVVEHVVEVGDGALHPRPVRLVDDDARVHVLLLRDDEESIEQASLE